MRHAVSAAALFATLAAAGLAAAQPADPPDDQTGDDDDGQGAGADATPADVKDAGAAPTPASTAETESVDALRRRYFELRDKLFRSRARAAAVASALYSTRVEIGLDYKTPRHQTVTRATIRLDGANVYDDTQGQIAQDEAVRFEGYVAPGRHRVTIRVEATAKDDDRFTTASETTFVVEAPRGKDLIVKARAKDDGDMGYRWQRKSAGNYRLRLDIDVEAKKATGGKKGGLIKRSSRPRKRRVRRASR